MYGAVKGTVLLGDVVERIVVPVTALPGPDAGEPTTEMFALEALRRVLVATLRNWAQAELDAAEGIACVVIDLVVQAPAALRCADWSEAVMCTGASGGDADRTPWRSIGDPRGRE
ncbi:hypothetical protein AB0M92_24025 [Streptomyces sp. NPDC051582]|uniref:hypothetical protein n=1 Tax=Streptomyces sp. NPDC051582 TaxID=3155167 RepID=UPI00341E251C